jgi:hypothetical protein
LGAAAFVNNACTRDPPTGRQPGRGKAMPINMPAPKKRRICRTPAFDCNLAGRAVGAQNGAAAQHRKFQLFVDIVVRTITDSAPDGA